MKLSEQPRKILLDLITLIDEAEPEREWDITRLADESYRLEIARSQGRRSLLRDLSIALSQQGESP